MPQTLRIIGDVHGKYGHYLNLIKKPHYSLQVGDLGFEYSCLDGIDPERHRVLGGNHDNYTANLDGKFIIQPPHFLGDFGTVKLGSLSIFFVRGSRSIDWRQRTPGVDFWSAEELTPERLEAATRAYADTKPDFVVTHDCPAFVIPYVSQFTHYDGEVLHPSRTAHWLDLMHGIHQPRSWIFGHYHKNWRGRLALTNFVCLDELAHWDIAV
jgi:hypothetical protein